MTQERLAASFQSLNIILLTVESPGCQLARIGDHAIIGDCRSAALVSKYGSVDWLCWPRFDSPSIFAAILDTEKGGYWSIRPSEPFEANRAYLHDSNVLKTEFVCHSGRTVLTDLMPAFSEEYKKNEFCPDHELIREIRCTAGQVQIEVEFYPRSHYGCSPIQFRSMNSLGLWGDVGRGAYWLRSTIPLRVADDRVSALFTLKTGDTAQFCLTFGEESPAVLPALGQAVGDTIQQSIAWWQKWAAQSKYDGPYREAVTRSALTLKLLAYAPSGAVVAAPTTSLPERIGDSLNWDYRYCWLRDASLTVRALLGLGYHTEAESFLTWLLHTTRLTQPQLRVLYNVFGRIRGSNERELAYLDGYRNSRPVRIGNGARGQLQLDVYGEVVEATAQYAERIGRFDKTTQRVLLGFGKYVADNWDRPDEGIWESRSGRKNHTHSRLMCWTTLDRLLALGDKKLLDDVPRERFTRERDRIRQQIESRAWNQSLQSYVSVLDGDGFDATSLRLAWYGFEHADSDRMKQTYRKIRQKLGAGDHLLYRYHRQPPEGAFGVCGFWEVEHLALGGGTLEDAHHAFQQLLSYQNDVGLFAEEIDPGTGQALGNFPQAFTHIGLISAALTLAEQERGKAHPAIHTGSDVKPSRAEATA